MATITVPGMFLTGTHGARPAANAVGIGTLYACSTHALVYQSDGSTWSQWFDGGAATLSAGSNSTRVREVSTAGASSTLWSPFDHAHDGIGTITASSSNTLQRGTVNLRAGSNIVFGLTDSDGDGELDTVTIAGAAAGGGGSSLTVADEGSPLSTAATTLDFVGAGVVASGSGATKTITIAGGGSAAPAFPLDDRTLHATYGDHYDGPTLDAIWTRRGLPNPSERFITDSWMDIHEYSGTNFGHLQSWTPTNEAEVVIAGSYFTTGDDGWGPCILDSSGTGVWLGFRNTARLGIFAVTTYTTGTEPASADIDPADGREMMGEGRKVWMSLIKKGAIYYFRVSTNGATWTTHELTGYTPSAFTPSQIGWLQGVQDAGSTKRRISIDWFDVIEGSIGNNLMVTPTSGTVTPTASASSIGAPADVIDANLGDAWADVNSTGSIWWNAAFSVNQTLNRLRIWGYTNAWGHGYVEFSSGTKIPFYCEASRVMHLDFPTETTSFVKVWCLKVGHGTFPGFYEIEAYLAT